MKKNKLAERLIYLREREGRTKTDVIKLINTKNLSTYANWEYGIREPELDTVISIAKLYGVSTDFLLGITNNEYVNKDKFLMKVDNEELKDWYASIAEEATDKDIEKLYKIWNILHHE